MTKVSESWSTSLPVRTMAVEVSSFIVTLWLLATGASLSGVTVRLTVAGVLLVVPSLTRNVIVSAPWKMGRASCRGGVVWAGEALVGQLVGPLGIEKVGGCWSP